MRFGELADFFEGVGSKRLSSHEVDPSVSRGHEFQGVDSLRKFLGTPSEKMRVPVTYIWMPDDEPEIVNSEGTWYDSRANQSHREAEYRLYYRKAAEEVVYRAKDGDSLFLAKRKGGGLLAILCPAGSTSEAQLSWLLGVSPVSGDMAPVELRTGESPTLTFFARDILERIGIDAPQEDETLLEKLLRRFNGRFPPTSDLSTFARESCEAEESSGPDEILVAWLETEEKLFRTLEAHMVGEVLRNGFLQPDGVPDIDRFVSFSLSVQNRRKSRAGYALENHLAELFRQARLEFSTQATTEGRKRPDFLFPNERAYRDATFPTAQLVMLGSKSSCKERWRQVLSEADRIESKHLATLEPGISGYQLDEMAAARLTLVVPSAIHATYPASHRNKLLDLAGFIDLVRKKQAVPV